jgi:hypothetical protein
MPEKKPLAFSVSKIYHPILFFHLLKYLLYLFKYLPHLFHRNMLLFLLPSVEYDQTSQTVEMKVDESNKSLSFHLWPFSSGYLPHLSP